MLISRFISRLTVSVAALAVAMPALAQAPWSASGTIADGDSAGAGAGEDQRLHDDHVLRLEAGRRYRISVDSEAFDPIATLYRVGGTEQLARDDDGGAGLNARLDYQPAETGDYVLRVNAFSSEGRGAYAASVALRPPLPAAIAAPASGSGRLEDGDEADEEGGRFDELVVRLEAGRRYRFTADSDDFDAVARLYAPGAGESPVAENDDAEGRNPRLSYAPRESGDHVLRIASFAEDGRGAYRYGVALQPPLPPPSTFFSRMEATIWRVYTGTLEASDPDDNGRSFDDYAIRFEAGQSRTISLEAEAFDTVVKIYRPGERDGDPAGEDDDGGGGVNSMLSFTAETAGDYVVRVTSFGNEGRGAYRLRVSE